MGQRLVNAGPGNSRKVIVGYGWRKADPVSPAAAVPDELAGFRVFGSIQALRRRLSLLSDPDLVYNVYEHVIDDPPSAREERLRRKFGKHMSPGVRHRWIGTDHEHLQAGQEIPRRLWRWLNTDPACQPPVVYLTFFGPYAANGVFSTVEGAIAFMESRVSDYTMRRYNVLL